MPPTKKQKKSGAATGRNRCGIVHFTSKQLSHFVQKTDFDKLPKEGSEQLIWTS